MKITLKDAASAIGAYAAATKKDSEPQDEVLRRAKVCMACPRKEKTRGVSRISEYLGKLSGEHGVPRDISGFSCGICSCSMLLLLPAKPENLHKDTPAQDAKRKNTKCWMNDL